MSNYVDYSKIKDKNTGELLSKVITDIKQAPYKGEEIEYTRIDSNTIDATDKGIIGIRAGSGIVIHTITGGKNAQFIDLSVRDVGITVSTSGNIRNVGNLSQNVPGNTNTLLVFIGRIWFRFA